MHAADKWRVEGPAALEFARAQVHVARAVQRAALEPDRAWARVVRAGRKVELESDQA